jgi:SSS family solute:Na+ symporter/sodium/proline symporter
MAVFFWRRANAAGAVASILMGTVVTIAWNVAGIESVDAIYPALIVSLVALIGVSLTTARPPVEKWKPFFDEAR